jgi:hypothetical protein
MDKCWFKLRQPDYTPEDEAAMGTGRETSALCLGHFVSSLKRLDFVLNKGEIEEFPPNMSVYSTETLQFKWHDADTATTGGGLGAGVPIAALAGLVLKASISAIFKRSVQNWEEYDRLDTYIFQPDRTYVEEFLEGVKLSEQVEILEKATMGDDGVEEKKTNKTKADTVQHTKLAKETEGKKAWSMFLVTGVKVARKGKKAVVESDKKTVKGELEAYDSHLMFSLCKSKYGSSAIQRQ